jgi:2-desacetyl-2-hydroxyethyl bacteriochlorophyllide A dehydrogenase
MPQVVVFPAPRHAELQEVDSQPVGAHELGLRTRCTLISTGTEGIIFARRFDEGTHWARGATYPFRPGYSVVATVEQVGTEVTGFAIGDRVVVRERHASHHVVDASRCGRVPNEVSDEQAAWFALAKISFVGARAAELRPGARALVVGAGPIGQMTVRWAAAAGSSDIVAVDVAANRLAFAAAGGATAVVAGTLDARHDEIAQGFRGHAPEVVIDTTGNAQVLPQALRAVGDHGRVVLLGDTGSPSEQRLTSDLIIRGVSIVGAHDGYTQDDPRWDNDREIYRLFFRLVAAGRFPLEGLISHRFQPQDCVAAYELAERARADTMGMLFEWPAS